MSHSEMVERVAKVLINWGHSDDSWGAARAVIDCMREPTEEMMSAHDALDSWDLDEYGTALEHWRAMIDAALADATMTAPTNPAPSTGT